MLNLNIPHYCHISLTYIMDFDIEIIHEIFQTACSHASHCHCCNVDFVLFHSVTCYSSSLLSRIHVNTTYLPNIICALGRQMYDVREVRVSEDI